MTSRVSLTDKNKLFGIWICTLYGLRHARNSVLSSSVDRSKHPAKMVLKKIDNRIRVLIENGVQLRHRSLFFIVGDKGRDQVRNSKWAVNSVSWCIYKRIVYDHKKLSFLSTWNGGNFRRSAGSGMLLFRETNMCGASWSSYYLWALFSPSSFEADNVPVSSVCIFKVVYRYYRPVTQWGH